MSDEALWWCCACGLNNEPAQPEYGYGEWEKTDCECNAAYVVTLSEAAAVSQKYALAGVSMARELLMSFVAKAKP